GGAGWRQGTPRGGARGAGRRPGPAVPVAQARKRGELSGETAPARVAAEAPGGLRASRVRRCQTRLGAPPPGAAARERIRGGEPGRGARGHAHAAPPRCLPRVRRELQDHEPDRERDEPARSADPSCHPLADQRSEAALVCRRALGHGAAIPTREELSDTRAARTTGSVTPGTIANAGIPRSSIAPR